VVNIETIDLSSRGVTLPSDRVGMVILQPFLELSAAEPFQCADGSKNRQTAAIAQTLEIARAAHHQAAKTHFTIFPEYSICGLAAAQQIQDAINAAAWPNATVILGGTDALSKADFTTLAAQPNTFVAIQNAPANIPDGRWINCMIVWVKGANGLVEKWLQPKVSPAWPEQNVPCEDMFSGKSIYAFRGIFDNNRPYRFSSLICYDWVASVETKKVWQWILEELERQANAAGGDFALSWFFVIQHNDKPSHDTFLSEVGRFFDQNLLPSVRRENTCLVFANSAGLAGPGRTTNHGQTSLIFSPQTLFPMAANFPDGICKPTFCVGGFAYRASNLLANFHDMLFRERGACIHSFSQINPASLNIGPGGRQIALQNASVFPVPGTTDVRAPSGPVPASVKWLNDQLDSLPSLASNYGTVPLAASANASHTQTIGVIRQINGQKAIESVKLATQQTVAKNADAWGNTEAEALEHLVHTLDILSLGSTAPTISQEKAHAKVNLNGQVIDVVAVRGDSHQSCYQHSEKHFGMPRRQTLLVSRDRDNNPSQKRHGSILRTSTSALGQEARITDPAANLVQIGYRNILEIFQQSLNAGNIPGAIDAWLTA
jgi:hypothetical protein